MATVTAFTAARSLAIENSSVTTGAVDASGNLILTTRGGTAINAGYVVGPAGTPVNTLQQTVKNNTGFTINKGSAVYISGATGVNALISKAQANSEATSSKTLGLVSANILNGNTGTVTTEGELTGLDTSAATAGDAVWLSGTTPGGLVYGISNKPVSPTHMVYLGVVIRAHATQGIINVKVQNGFELDELHDVVISSPAVTNVLARNTANDGWVNKNITAAMQPAGAILQVASAFITTNPTTTSGTPVAITGLTVTLTPRSSTSKFLLMAQIDHGTTSTGGTNSYFNLARGSTILGAGTGGTVNSASVVYFGDNTEMRTMNLAYLDSPATASAVTYNVYFHTYSNGVTNASINRRGVDTTYRGGSSLIVMEVAA